MHSWLEHCNDILPGTAEIWSKWLHSVQNIVARLLSKVSGFNKGRDGRRSIVSINCFNRCGHGLNSGDPVSSEICHLLRQIMILKASSIPTLHGQWRTERGAKEAMAPPMAAPKNGGDARKKCSQWSWLANSEPLHVQSPPPLHTWEFISELMMCCYSWM